MPYLSKGKAQWRKNLAKARDAKNSEITEISNHVVEKRPFTERPPEILESQLRSGAEKAETVGTNDQNHAILFESNNMAALIQQTSCSQCQSKGTLQLITTSMSVVPVLLTNFKVV